MSKKETAAFGAKFKTWIYGVWALVATALVRDIYHQEAIAFDMELELLDIPPKLRHDVFARMKDRRQKRESDVNDPNAFERYQAIAEVLGFGPVSDPTPVSSEASHAEAR